LTRQAFDNIKLGKRAFKMDNNVQYIILDYLAKLIKDERDYIKGQKEDIFIDSIIKKS
jgi:hypothetical protein